MTVDRTPGEGRQDAPPSPLTPRRSLDEIDALARDLGPMARNDPQGLTARLERLSVQDRLELILRLPAEERLEMLLHAPRPMALVRSIPDVEFHLTAREVGPADALPLLAMGSPSQILHVVDMEAWRIDRFDPERAGAWIAVLLESGEPTLRRFLRNADEEMLVLLFRDWARVSSIRIDDQQPVDGHGETEAGNEEGTVSPDGAYRFSPVHPEHAPAIRRMAEILFIEQQERYFRLLWAAHHELPSELEELALRWRQSRLEEQGLPPWDEAIQVYAPPAAVASRLETAAPGDDAPLAPRSVWRATAPGSFLAAALDRVDDAHREAALMGLSALAGRVLVADRADTGDLESQRHALDRAASYVLVALEARGAADASEAAQILSDVAPMDLFREGYAVASRVQERARRFVREGWPGGDSRGVAMLDPPLHGVVGALLQPRPLRFDPLATKPELAVRDFKGLDELRDAEAMIELAERVGRAVVTGLGVNVAAVLGDAESAHAEPPRLSALLLTGVAWHATRGELRASPLPEDVLADFLRTVASRRTAAPEAPERALERFVAALASSGAVVAAEAPAIRAFGLVCLDRLSDQCGGLDPGAPVPAKKVTCLRIA